MQTFLPYADFAASAAVLDRQRLGKQRVEVLQLLDATNPENPTRGWRNHPCAKMWADFRPALAHYGLLICHEWVRRGYRDTCAEKIVRRAMPEVLGPLRVPDWFGDDAFHRSHRSNLLRKLPTHYRTHWPDEPDDLPYVWPT
jgi:hypothetical protein